VKNKRAPVFGTNVDMGTPGKLIDPLLINDIVQISATAVMLCDVPDNSVAAGVAAVVKLRGSNGGVGLGDDVVR
jgi:serine O-acetyltransferase